MPGGGRYPGAVQASVAMKEYSAPGAGAPKPDKLTVYLNNVAQRMRPAVMAGKRKKEAVRRSLRRLLFHPNLVGQIKDYILFLLKFIEDLLKTPQASGLSNLTACSGGGGGSSGIGGKNTGRGPPSAAGKAVVLSEWIMKQDPKTLETMIEAPWLKRAAVGIAAIVALTIGAGTVQKANAADYGAIQNLQTGKPETAVTIGVGVYDKDGKPIGTRVGNGLPTI